MRRRLTDLLSPLIIMNCCALRCAVLLQRWPGQNFFLCDGRLITGPSLGGFYFTFGITAATIGLFHAFSSPYLWNHVSPAIPLVCA